MIFAFAEFQEDVGVGNPIASFTADDLDDEAHNNVLTYSFSPNVSPDIRNMFDIVSQEISSGVIKKHSAVVILRQVSVRFFKII